MPAARLRLCRAESGTPLDGTVSGVGEVVGALMWGEEVEELSLLCAMWPRRLCAGLCA